MKQEPIAETTIPSVDGTATPEPSAETTIVSVDGTAAPETITGTTAPTQQDGVAMPEGHRLTAGFTNPTAFIRRKINEICDETHTRALAWALHWHHEDPKMTVEQLFDFLDEIGARPKAVGDKCTTWSAYLGNDRTKSEHMVTRIRALLRKNGVEVNQ